MKILLAKRRALGDTVMLTSSVEMLACSMPEAEISVLAPEAFLPVLQGHPRIRNLWSFEEGRLSLLRRIRSERFDHFFQLHASPRARWLAWASGAKAVHLHFQNSVTERAYGRHPNALEWDGFLFRTVFGEKVSLPAPSPRIFLREEEKEAGAAYWRARGADPRKVVFLGFGASRSTKRWLPAHFARLALLLRERDELIPAFVVGPGEEEELFAGKVIDEMRALGLRPREAGERGDFVHGTGLGLRDLSCAISTVRAYVGNDSGPKHMAVALGVPSFTLFGPEDPVEWHPYSRQEHPVFFLEGLRCRTEDQGRWCGIPVCVKEQHRCMRDIDPYDVYAELSRLWRDS